MWEGKHGLPWHSHSLSSPEREGSTVAFWVSGGSGFVLVLTCKPPSTSIITIHPWLPICCLFLKKLILFFCCLINLLCITEALCDFWPSLAVGSFVTSVFLPDRSFLLNAWELSVPLSFQQGTAGLRTFCYISDLKWLSFDPKAPANDRPHANLLGRSESKW